MKKRSFLSGAWLVVAAILLYVAASDISRWRADPEFIRLGLTWTDSYLPHGMVAAVVAVAILSQHRIALWMTLVASALFGLYFAAYLVFGGEGSIILRILVPLVLLTLTALTIRWATGALRGGT